MPNNNSVRSCCENYIDELYLLESILKMTKDSCEKKEFLSVYYNLPHKYKSTLSEERNHYINMISLALDKINSLKRINCDIESLIHSL